MYVLPAHTFGKTQFLDVVLFSMSKNRLRNSVRSFAAPGLGKEYDISELCSLLRDAHFRSFNASNIQASFYRSGIWPLDSGTLLNTPRPRNGDADADFLSVEELYTAFQEKQRVLRNSILRDDSKMTRSGFIDISKSAVVLSPKSLELARRRRQLDIDKFRDEQLKEARRTTRQDRRDQTAAQRAWPYRAMRMNNCASSANTEIKEFMAGIRSIRERRAVARLRTQFKMCETTGIPSVN